MFGLSGEHVVILFIILLIFGPRKLPELGNTLGKALKNFKDSVAGVEQAKYRKIDDETDKATVVSETKVGESSGDPTKPS
jgi:sec-independent protein translocase protein TatA